MTPPFRILDLSLNLPGPYATAVLARQGADVVKLEPPRGDPARHMPGFFARLNAGKRSVVLDLRDPTSHAAMWRLVEWADVLVEGFRPGVLERLGFAPHDLHARNPGLVICRISAFGQDHPQRNHPAHDLNLQASTGLAWLERSRSGPRGVRLPVADLSAGLTAAARIQHALAGDRDCVVLDVSMEQTLAEWTALWATLDPGAMADPWIADQPRVVQRVARRAVAPLRARLRREKLDALPGYGLFRAADGWLALGVVDEAHFWRRLTTTLGLDRHAEHPMVTRTLLGPLLRRRIAARLRRRPVAHWLAVFAEQGVPVTAVERPRANAPTARAPALGEHTVSVLDSA
jgi:crotonobetainyl-CoA:carnitine CoA-transferase CaiB-like acyl-CoA transferase